MHDHRSEQPMQPDLFHQSSKLPFIDHDLGDACIREYPRLFAPAYADELLEMLLAQIPWRQDSVRMAGKRIPVPRLQCWMGDHGSGYGYSGTRALAAANHGNKAEDPGPWPC